MARFCAMQQDWKALARRRLIADRERRLTKSVWRLILLLVAVLSLQVTAYAAQPAAKRVMILNSFGNDFRPWGAYARTIRSELSRQTRWPLDILDQLLVTARSSDENPEVPFVDYLTALYAKHPPDLIICIGAPAANFVQRQRNRLFRTVPMLMTAVEERRIRFGSLTENDAVVAVRHDFAASFDTILRVLPNTKKSWSSTAPRQTRSSGSVRCKRKRSRSRAALASNGSKTSRMRPF
jgi:hypothetical protein